jgi:hypothetical protein
MITKGRKLLEAGDPSGSKLVMTGYLNSGLTIFVIACVCTVLLWAAARWMTVWLGKDVKKVG